MNVAAYLKERSQLADRALDGYTARGNAGRPGCPNLAGIPPLLLEAMRYSLLAGGKRLRPVLVFAAAELFGATPQQVMPAACALEMIHTYSLIHDDLPCMDDDDLRRGRPTNHKVYGEAMATLAGDALQTMAFEMMALQADVEGVTPSSALRAAKELAVASGAAGMVGGQVLDLSWESREPALEDLREIHRLKTGALFQAALRMGAVLAGATEADLARLDQYADHFGLAFQIQDDILDVIGDAVKTGKGVGRDMRHQKSTYVRLFGVDGATQMARNEVAAAIAALAPFGDRAQALTALVEFVVDRDG